MPPPPRVEIREQIIQATDYFAAESPWIEGGFPWLQCHRGHLWLFVPDLPGALCFGQFCYLTRGLWKDSGEERIELFFASSIRPSRTVVTLRAWQCNRFPGWEPGKRSWRIHLIVRNGRDASGFQHLTWRTVFWRAAPLPCMLPWEGPRPDAQFVRESKLLRTKEEEREFWSGMHILNGTFDHKKPKRPADGWFHSLRSRYGDPDGDDAPF